MKRIVPLILALALCVSLFPGAAVTLAAENGVLQGGTADASAGGTASFPVSITANPGLAGFRVYVLCDTSVFQAQTGTGGCTVLPGAALGGNGGLLCSPYQGSLGTGWQILWYNTQNVSLDGTLFTLPLTVAEDAAAGEYPVHIAYLPEDTLDESLNEVPLTAEDGLIRVNTDGPTIYGGNLSVEDGTELLYPVSIRSNPGIAAFMIYLDCDPSVFCPTLIGDGPQCEVSKGDLGGSGIYCTLNGGEGYRIGWMNTCNVTTDGLLFSLRLTVAQDTPEGDYPIAIRYSPDDTVNDAYEPVAFQVQNGCISVYHVDPCAEGHTLTYTPASEPTCEENGVVEHWTCSVCGRHFADEACTEELTELYTPALGHIYSYSVTEQPTLSEAGCLTGICSRCDSEVHIPLPVLTTADYSLRVIQAPTCTGTGRSRFTWNVTEYGIYFFTVDTPALGHLLEQAEPNNDGTHTGVCSRCGEEVTEDCTFDDDGVCTVCGWERPGSTEPEYNGSLQLFYSFSLSEQITPVFTLTASSVSSYADYYVVVEKPGADPFVIHKDEMTTYGTSAFRAAYNGIAAKEMGVEFTATLYAADNSGKVFYGPSVTKVIKNELTTRLKNTSNPDKTRTLCADMLNYGAAAQVYFGYDTDNLVNQGEDIAEALAECMTNDTPTAVNSQAVTGTGGTLFPSASLSNRVVLNLKGAMTGGSDVKLNVMDQGGNVLMTLDTEAMNANLFQVNFDQVGAKDMRTVYRFQFVDLGGVSADSRILTWSVESFVAQKLASNDPGTPTYELARALLIFGDSARAYLGN